MNNQSSWISGTSSVRFKSFEKAPSEDLKNGIKMFGLIQRILKSMHTGVYVNFIPQCNAFLSVRFLNVLY